MSDRDALLRAILTAPEDDAPRLVYADWCDENGQPERAEFVRVQVALARMDRGVAGRGVNAHKQAIRRQRQLLAAHGRQWAAPVVHAIKGADGKHFDWVATHADFNSTRTVRWTWSRGFLDSITLSAADWLAHHAALAWHPAHCAHDMPATAQPLTTVVLTTRPEWEPVGPGEGCRLVGDPERRAFLSRDHEAAGLRGSLVANLLQLRWPWLAVELPPEPVVLRARHLTTHVMVTEELLNDARPMDLELPVRPDIARVLFGDPSALTPRGIINVEDPHGVGADAPVSAPPASAPPASARRPGHSRMPAWLSRDRARRPSRPR